MAASLGLLQLIQQTSILPNVISLSAAISACVKGPQWQQALGLWLWCSRLVLCLALCPTRPNQCLCKSSALAAGSGSSGGDAADLCSAWHHFLLSRDQCL